MFVDRKIFSALFSRNNFFTRRDTKRATSQREFVRLLSNLDSRVHIINKNVSAIFLFLNTFFSRAIFVRSLHIFFKPYFKNVLQLFVEIEYGKSQTRFFSALAWETEECKQALRACLHGSWGPQVGEVTRLALVEKWPAFTCKLTTPGSRGDVTRCCCVVARHVNRENGGRTTHFGGQCSFPLIICSRCNISVLWLFTVTFGALWRACKCNVNSTPARRVTPP